MADDRVNVSPPSDEPGIRGNQSEETSAAANPAQRDGKQDGKPATEAILDLLRAKPLIRKAALILCLVGIPVSAFGVWWVWLRVLPGLWAWGFTDLTIRSLIASFAVFFVALLPPYVPVFITIAAIKILALYAEVETQKTTEAVRKGSSEQAIVEEELKGADQSGLILLLRYSRVQMEAYYGIGLTQTQRSFLYSVVAMWIGFIVILAGITLRVVDLGRIGLKPADPEVSTLAVLSGIIIELISALFLWIYRSSVKQLTYFYDRQMFNHSVLMCHRIAETMTGGGDEVKKLIAERSLDKVWTFEQQALPQGDRLMSFASKKS